MRICIIGSGPAGVIAVDYLKNIKKLKIDILDVGINDKKKYNINSNSFIPPKIAFNNSFMYKRADNLKLVFDKFSNFFTSHALGGLSNVWGANISCIHNKYLKSWKINKKIFYESFNYVLKKMKICARKDMIDDLYDVKLSNTHLIKSGLSYDHSVFDEKNIIFLKQKNLYIGASKLALNINKCTMISECLTGCKNRAIFNSADLIKNTFVNSDINYKKGILVLKFIEKKDKVHVIVKNISSQKNLILKYDYLIIAAGCVDSTLIVKKSILDNENDFNFKILESKKFYFPVFSRKILSSNNLDNSISLSHIFIQCKNKNSLVHCQLYPLYFMLEWILINKLGKYSVFLIKPFKWVLKYFFLAMVYLDSEDSGYLLANYKDNILNVKGFENSKSKKRLDFFIKKMKSCIKVTDLIPVNIVLSSKLGQSQHFGSTMRMKITPNINQTDFYGRPHKHKRTFIIDSSVLPSIPSSPTTINIMANAVRICKKIESLLKKEGLSSAN